MTARQSQGRHQRLRPQPAHVEHLAVVPDHLERPENLDLHV